MYAEMAELEKNHWWFQGRRNVVFDLMRRFAPKGKLLDIGLGTGFNAKAFSEQGYDVHGLDPAPEAIAFAKKTAPNVAILQSGFPSHEVPSDTYDVVALLDVLEHLKDDMTALEDVHRVLKKGGIAVITVPAFRFLWSPHDERAHHFRRYRKHELRKLFLETGFEVHVLSYYNFFLFPLIALVRLVGKLSYKHESNDFDKSPAFLNRVLAWIFSSERFLLRIIPLPFGVSLVAVVRKS